MSPLLINTWSGAAWITSTGAPPAPVYEAFTIGAFCPEIDKPVGHRIPLTVWEGDYYLTTPNQSISGLEIRGRLYVNSAATNCRVTDCKITGADPAGVAPTTFDAIVSGASLNLRGLVMEWCTIDGTGRETAWTDGIRGGNYTIRYSELTRCVDPVSAVIVGNATIEGCWIHNLVHFAWMNSDVSSTTSWTNYTYDGVFYSVFPGQSDKYAHADGMQIHQHQGWVFRGNYVGGPYSGYWSQLFANRDPSKPAQKAVIDLIDAGEGDMNAGIMIGVASSGGVVALIEKNWFRTCNANINCATKPSLGDYLAGVTIRDNKFYSSPGLQIYTSRDFAGTLSNNTYVDTGLPVPHTLYPV